MLFLTLLNNPAGFGMSHLPKSTGQSEGKLYSLLLPPTLLATALKTAVTVVCAHEKREVLCRNFHKIISKVAARREARCILPHRR